jgi:hypothetical protein
MSGMVENIRVFMKAVEHGSLSEAGRVMRLSSAVPATASACWRSISAATC